MIYPLTPKRKELYKRLYEALKQELRRRVSLRHKHEWMRHARPKQLPPSGEWRVWLILAGRGFGKTRTGAETLRAWIAQGLYRRIALIGETESDVRHVMVEGDSGILNVHHPEERPTYESSRRQIIWKNGAIATCFSAQAEGQLRGPQFDLAWVDELAKFPNPEAVWDQLMLALRLGNQPRVIVTTTPRNIPFIKKLCESTDVIITHGSTFENKGNLARSFIDYVSRHYKGSRLGRQELLGELLTDTAGALWTPTLLEKARADYSESPLTRIVVAIDPAVTSGQKSDETGIIVAGLNDRGHGVILSDLSGKMSTLEWTQKAAEAYHTFNADRVVAEVNQGGDMVEIMLRQLDPSISYRAVRATRGKLTRAEPIASLYEQGKVFHKEHMEELERQLCSYTTTSAKSPDRMDALVWALTDLMLTGSNRPNLWTMMKGR